jgi:hypothetical protein
MDASSSSLGRDEDILSKVYPYFKGKRMNMIKKGGDRFSSSLLHP